MLSLVTGRALDSNPYGMFWIMIVKGPRILTTI